MKHRVAILAVALGLTAGCGGPNAPVPATPSGTGAPTAVPTGVPAKPSLEIQPFQLTQADWKLIMGDLPAIFREGLTGGDEENARDLGLLAWAFDYKNGPLLCWVEIAETGQQTVEPPGPGQPGQLNAFPTGAAQGRVLLWFQPRTSTAMRQDIRDRLGKKPKEVPDFYLALTAGDAPVAHISRVPGFGEVQTPLWFGWGKADLKESANAATVGDGAEATLLSLEAAERGAAQPRSAKLLLKAKPNRQ